ncbi:hypothetical protein LCGC14_1039980 [marine sediment metagenome]|uniref:SMC-Scp complex subunit ScpB n=1 Tax=marine sediment metagenome TaxID=412755 RepID=A0A0F9QY70_9ZZZZ
MKMNEREENLEENHENNNKDETDEGFKEIHNEKMINFEKPDELSEDLAEEDLVEEKINEDLNKEVQIKKQLMETSTGSQELNEETLKQQIRDFHRNLIEASLYAAGSPLTIEEISNKLELPKKEVEALVNELVFDYLDRSGALIVNQVGEAYQLALKPEYVEKVSKFAKGGAIAERYLRTLTIIALKQPILKSMVIKLRGSGAYEHVKYLLDNQFINAIKKGRSQELTTTDKYADMFGLPKDIRQMKNIMVKQLGIEPESSYKHPGGSES